MSWMAEMSGKPLPTHVDTANDDPTPKVADPSIPGRMVREKNANVPFLTHQLYQEKQNALHDEWAERKNAHEEAVKKGERKGPFKEVDPTEPVEVGCLGFLKFLFYCTVLGLLLGKLFTGSYTWDTVDLNLRQFIPKNERLFTENLLSQYDGTSKDEQKPIYLAIDGDVYDVSSKRHTYGLGGSYHFMAGRDAVRAFATGCFDEHRTHDLRGLDEQEMASVNHWKKFFAEHKEYRKAGRVVHKPIDPLSPIPLHCIEEKRAKQLAERAQQSETDSASPPEPNTEQEGAAVHQEL